MLRSRDRVALAVAAGCCWGLVFPVSGGAVDGTAPHFHLIAGSARPHHAFYAGASVRIRFTFSADRAVDLQVRIVKRRSRQVVREFVLRRSEPGHHHLIWAGRSGSGAEAPEGRYLVLVGRRGHNLARAAGFAFHGHVFPVRGPHGARGAIGRFGAPRSGGRTHEGFDVVAACRTPLEASRGGRVLRRGYDPVLYGNYVLIHGRGEHRSYFYAHLPAVAGPPRRAGPHRAADRGGRGDRQRDHGRLPPALRGPRPRQAGRPGALAAALGSIQLIEWDDRCSLLEDSPPASGTPRVGLA